MERGGGGYAVGRGGRGLGRGRKARGVTVRNTIKTVAFYFIKKNN